MSRVLAVIPARYASTRFPGKPLVDLCGQTMIERVWRATRRSSCVDRVLVATESALVADECNRIGAECILTSDTLLTGTDRVAEALLGLDEDYEIVCNIQGDEPLVQATLIDALITALRARTDADVATPVIRVSGHDELHSPTTCKVCVRSDSTALYFSRSVIPFVRAADGQNQRQPIDYLKHIGIYVYRRTALQRFTTLAPSSLELAESLEQLRLLQDGARYLCVETNDTLVAVDVPEDAVRVRSMLGC